MSDPMFYRLRSLELAVDNIEGTPQGVVEAAEIYYAYLQAGAAMIIVPEPVKPAKEAKPKEDKYVVYHLDGTRRAGYTHSKDAVQVYLAEFTESVKTMEDVGVFQKVNGEGLAKLSKEDTVTAGQGIATHVRGLQDAEKVPAAIAPPQEVAETPTDDDAMLAAMFAGENAGDVQAVVEAAPPPVDKAEFVKKMMALARVMGGPEASAWIKKAGFDHITKVPADQYATVIASAEARVKELQGS